MSPTAASRLAAKRSVGARLCANSSNASGVVAIGPAERSALLSTNATSLCGPSATIGW